MLLEYLHTFPCDSVTVLYAGMGQRKDCPDPSPGEDALQQICPTYVTGSATDAFSLQ